MVDGKQKLGKNASLSHAHDSELTLKQNTNPRSPCTVLNEYRRLRQIRARKH